jgi:LuxR family maltose regulon positive regulatory protein
MEDFALHCLGRPFLLRDGLPVKFEMRKSLAMLVYLRTMAREYTREYLEALFWPEYSQKSAQASLRRALSSLKKSLNEPLLETDREMIGLKDYQQISLDVENFQSILASVKTHDHIDEQLCQGCLQKIEEAQRLYKGDFMEGFNLKDCPEFDDWQLNQREEAKRDLSYILERLGRAYAAQGEWEKAIQYTHRWVKLDPLNETSQQMLIQIYAWMGQPDAALHQYEYLSKVLREELGQAPSEETAALFRETRKEVSEINSAQQIQSMPLIRENITQPLISTKMFVPAPRFNRVYRPRLLNLLGQTSQYPLTLICAPAGYGKTTLLAEWIQNCRESVKTENAHLHTNYKITWVSLDQDDNDPSRFLAYLLAALENTQPGIMTEARLLLGSPRALPSQALLSQIVNELQGLPFNLGLILDDYQSIHNPAVHEIITFLLDHQPDQLHLVISTRANPPLPLHRLRARNQLLDLRAKDLRFTYDETAAFLNDVMELSLLAEDIDTLENRTEGWIAGLQMAAISLQDLQDRSAFIHDFGGSHRFILEYLIEEILKRQSPETQSFLLQTSVLDRMCQPLCDALLGDSISGEVKLEDLERANLFLSPLDEIGCWYRYHTLFADLLRARLKQVQPDLIPVLHKRASRWYEREGIPLETVKHALEANDLERAAHLLEVFTMDFMERGEMSLLLNYVHQLPDDILRNNPELTVQQAWLLAFSGQIEQVEPLLTQLESQTLPDGHDHNYQEILGNIAIIRGFMADFRGDMAAAVRLANKADELLPGNSLLARSVVHYVLGDAYYTEGDLELAEQEYEKIQQIGSLSGNLWINEEAIFKIAQVKKLQGKLHAAFDLYEEVIASAKEKKFHNTASMAATYIGLSDLQREWNQLDAAQHAAMQAVRSMERWPISIDLVNGYLSLSRTAIAQGHMDTAEEALKKADEYSRKGELFKLTWKNLDACRVRLWLAENDLVAVHHWLEHHQIDTWFAEKSDTISTLEAMTVARAMIALDGERIDKAIRLLNQFTQSSRSAGQTALLIEFDTLLALAYRARGENQTALGFLNECLLLSQPEGYLRQFLNEGEIMKSMLEELRISVRGSDKKEESDLCRYIDQILSAFPDVQGFHPNLMKHIPSALTLIEPLSDRELEVLDLVCKGFSNREIAEKLVVTLDTVKKHNSHIFSKLGVTNRVQAVLEARKWGLVHDSNPNNDG